LDQAEVDRLKVLSRYERKGWRQKFQRIAGVDEAGRGPLAGPVVAAACCIPKGWSLAGVDDSKRLTADQREALYARITTDPTLQWGIGRVEHDRIDAINIHRATHEAMVQAIAQIDPAPDLLLVDGMGYRDSPTTTWTIVGGDHLSIAIAAASILAKVTRDRIMCAHHLDYPQYGFAQHKGYATAIHRAALATHGPCPIHRNSFLKTKVSDIA